MLKPPYREREICTLGYRSIAYPYLLNGLGSGDFDLRIQQSAAAQSSSPSRNPFWNAGRIVASVLVVLLIVGVSGFAAFNYVNNQSKPPSGSSNTCPNGATNYPSCNSCSS